MIKHLFKMIWNKKQKNFLVMLQLFFCFAIMFAVFTMGLYYYQSYKQPKGYDDTDVWAINRTADRNQHPNADISVEDSLRERNEAVLLDQVVKQEIGSLPEIKQITYTSVNTPFSNRIYSAEIASEKTVIRADQYTVENNYAELLGLTMQSGRWFSRDDDATNYTPVIINTKLKEELYGNEDALNKTTKVNGKDFKIIGIINNAKTMGDYAEPGYSIYRRADSSFYGWTDNKTILIKLKPGADAKFESRLHKSLAGLMKTSGIEVAYLEKKRKEANRDQLIPLIVLGILAVFFITNVALGLFGVLWYNINKRKGEIGLRMAVGATKNSISRQLVGEAMVIATVALTVGTFFAIQFPLLNVFDVPGITYIIALLLAIGFIYLLVLICAFYPGRQASAILPAVALHEE